MSEAVTPQDDARTSTSTPSPVAPDASRRSGTATGLALLALLVGVAGLGAGGWSFWQVQQLQGTERDQLAQLEDARGKTESLAQRNQQLAARLDALPTADELEARRRLVVELQGDQQHLSEQLKKVQTATRLLLFARCPPPPASWLPAGKASGVLRRDLERPTGDAVRGDGDGARSLSASLNGRWNEAEPDSRQAPPARPGMALHRRGAAAGHAGGRSLYVLSAVRSYVGGESLWSKGQKDAIYYLTLYADSRADEDFRRYEEAIAIPLGDREMRLALDQPDPDIERPARASSRAATMPTTLPRSSGCTATSTTSVTSSAPSSCGWWVTSTSWN